MGHRGANGEMTLRIHPEDAPLFAGITRVWEPRDERWFDVETCRSYADRLVLKLAGVDDATAASRFRGSVLQTERSDLPVLADGEWWNEDLVGLRLEADGREIGRVEEIIPRPGQDLLRVVGADARGQDRECLIPLVGDWIETIDVPQGRLAMRLPRGLVEVNDVDSSGVAPSDVETSGTAAEDGAEDG